MRTLQKRGWWGVLDKRHEEGKRVLGEREKLTEGAGKKEEKEKRSASKEETGEQWMQI